MYQAFLSLFWWIFECIKRFCHFFGGFSNVSSVFNTFLVDFRMYQAFLSLFWWTGDRGPETGDRTGNRGLETGDRTPETWDRGPGTGRRALGGN